MYLCWNCLGKDWELVWSDPGEEEEGSDHTAGESIIYVSRVIVDGVSDLS